MTKIYWITVPVAFLKLPSRNRLSRYLSYLFKESWNIRWCHWYIKISIDHRQIKRAEPIYVKMNDVLPNREYISQFAIPEGASWNEDRKGDVSSRDKTHESIRRSTRISRGNSSRILTTTTLLQPGVALKGVSKGCPKYEGGIGNRGKPDPLSGFPSTPPFVVTNDEKPHGNVGRPVERAKAVPWYS